MSKNKTNVRGATTTEHDELKRYGHPRFYELLESMADMHSRKNFNYAETGDPLSNLRSSEMIGIPAHLGTMVRLGDKWCRLVQLMKGKKDVVGESMRDTLMDLSVYCLLEIILLEELDKKNKK